MPEVGVILGSTSDLPLMEACLEQPETFGIEAGEVAARRGERRRALAGR